MLDEAILVTAAESPLAYRQRQAAWWTNESRECRELGMDDLALKCLDTAAGWLYGGDGVYRDSSARWEVGTP